LRRYLLFKKKVEEKVITLDELKKAEEIYVGNALRGLGKVIKWSIL
jgi:branched-subunit amino acid aminotransferase/4-amino-4-deoxychorismate lyase